MIAGDQRLIIAAVPAEAPALEPGAVAAMLIMNDGSATDRTIMPICALYGLSVVESQLACHIIAGRSVQEVSETMRRSVITRRGQLTGELQLEYARADRNRALFRGIEVVESVLVGVFDIKENRQDVLTSARMLRYGLSNRLEVGVRVPFVYRNDVSVLAPIQGSTGNDAAATTDSSAGGNGIGDVELSLRYQLTRAHAGSPFIIGNLQVVAPTGSNPFDVPRDSDGRELRAATGAGFWGVSPSLTAILPSDPRRAVRHDRLYAQLRRQREHAYPACAHHVREAWRFGFDQRGDRDRAQPAHIAEPGLCAHLGVRHADPLDARRSPLGDDGIREQKARDLQIGRLLFGVTYRVSDSASVNWSVEAGATDDATDLRTVLRIPFVLLTGR